jgi:hypothetical protein
VFLCRSFSCWRCVLTISRVNTMQQTLNSPADTVGRESFAAHAKSAISWPAIIAGAFVAAAVSLILFALGTGLGFASISPWSDRGISATTFAVTTAIWVIVVQWISAGFGGYIAGRLRSRWIGTHTHEVFFRDTAHGLVTWAVATVLIFAIVATSLVSAIGGGVRAVSGAVSAGARGAVSTVSSPASTYGVDKLFRSPASASAPATSDQRVEAGHIIANAVVAGSVTDEDRTYLADLVAAKSGISSAEAQKRVDDLVGTAVQTEAKVKAEADTARKAAAQASIYTALAMLIGAFIASVSAALGGHQRDEHV